MLYLGSPAGVCFSYSANKSFYDSANDTITAQDNLIFLQQWFVKFPEYKNRDFFIPGESYTGQYVPQLAKLIVESGLNFSLKGIAIGNPLLVYNTDLNSEGDFTGLTASYQMLLMNLSVQKLERILIFVYKEDLCLLEQERCARSSSCPACWNQQLELLQPVINNSHPLDLNFALNHEIVRSESSDIKYVYCGVVNYDGQNLEIPTIDVVGSLVSLGIRVLVYSRDQDSVIPFLGTRILVSTATYRPCLKINRLVDGHKYMDRS
ncbi:hypothetical protein GH714_035257 [Hevea brasiliensis]|uniref:Carboxypeptidase n=1 Tax=Hevea brasiliensis TaxID=3981 RepID=A0A6A6M5K5_HEVBR|nr:hypothetical protein GH714_035257 [Hevea brasiliensis]